MSKVTLNSFKYKDFTVADLSEADIVLQNKKRCQGLRYSLIKNTPEEQKNQTVTFQTVYVGLQALTNKIVKEEESACKSKPYIAALNEIKNFIPKLEAAEEAGRKHYEKQGILYKIFTVICRIFGKTPCKGTHAARLATLKVEIDQHIANMKAEYDLKIYAEIETIVNNNKGKEKIYINHHKKFPKASMNALIAVLTQLVNEAKITHAVILKDRIKIDLIELKDE